MIKNSEEEDYFIAKLIEAIKKIDIEQLMDKDSLELQVQEFTNKLDVIWYKYLKYINIIKYSKAWWNENYQSKLAKYRMSKHIDNWKVFRNTVKKTK